MLTDKQCQNAICPEDKKHKRFFDSGGLYLQVGTNGSKRWFYKYRIQTKEKQLALGSYPSVSLSEARIARDSAKIKKSKGVDPIEERKLQKLKGQINTGDTFKSVALDWHSKQKSGWSEDYGLKTLRQLERDFFPWFGHRGMTEIDPMEILGVVQKIEQRGANETAHRGLMMIGQIWNYWLPTAGIECRNITVGLKARLKPYVGKNYNAITEPKRFGELLRAIKNYKGGPIVRTALQLAPILFQRPGNLRMMEWNELDLENCLWTIPSSKVKRTKEAKQNGEDHIVPLPSQAIKLIRLIYPLTGQGKYVFPGERSHDRPISDNSVRSALYALGFGKEQGWNGFRASARTIMVDELNLDPLAIEANLAHAVKDSNGRSYNRTHYIKQRIEQIQIWANYLDRLASENKVITFVKVA